MRKIKLGVYFDTHFEPKGNKGDEIKERLNRKLRNSVEDIDQVVRYEITSSQRDYHNDGGSIITELKAYIEDGVNLYESDYRCVSESDVDVINNRLWHRIAERKSDSMKNDWNLREVETYDIEHVSTSVDKEKQIDVDMDDRQSYVKNSNRSPDFKQMRTLYNHEFEQAFESIMDQLRERLKLTDEKCLYLNVLVEQGVRLYPLPTPSLHAVPFAP